MQEIRICKIKNNELESILDQIERNSYYLRFKNKWNNKIIQQNEQNSNLSFIEELTFDKQSKYLIGYGMTKFFILNLSNSDG